MYITSSFHISHLEHPGPWTAIRPSLKPNGYLSQCLLLANSSQIANSQSSCFLRQLDLDILLAFLVGKGRDQCGELVSPEAALVRKGGRGGLSVSPPSACSLRLFL